MDPTNNNIVTQKLTAARTRLILDKPFLGALVMRLPLVDASDWCSTSGTDARNIYYNHTYIEALSLSQVQFVLAHEALHCGLSHFARRQHRQHRRWDVACDHAVNLLLADDELEHPQGALINPDYTGMSAEEIYPCIDADDNEQTMDQHLYDPEPDDTNTQPDTESQLGTTSDSKDNNNKTEAGQTDTGAQSNQGHEIDQQDSNNQSHAGVPPTPLTGTERDRLETQWQQRLAAAAQQAVQAGKLNNAIALMLERLLQPTLPWRSLLARYMNSATKIDYNLTRPSRRREGDAILPSLHTRQIDVVVALDTSGSITEMELNEFLNELNAIKGAMNARITLLACDDQLNTECPWLFEPWDRIDLPTRITGGGLTDFNPVFTWLAQTGQQPDIVIYFTDAKGRFPNQAPHLPVFWLVKGSAKVPWGQRIQLN